MSSRQPTKASPAGCVIGVFGIILLVFSVISGWIFYRLLTREVIDWSLLWKYGGGSLACLFVGLFVIRLGWKLALGADMSDPYSNTKPKIRF